DNLAGVDVQVWTRQHPAIEIDQTVDAITDRGQELYNLIVQREIVQILLMGVHTNMCILNRSFAIKQMVRWGQPIALIRDLTDAMYNPASSPYVDHATGTQLVIDYIEKHWCPTIHSTDLLP
ncbi:MAG: isochorismatase, partial [Anaerolineae bacterium]|nr:isochorismatase [Anaerolineae bacterium]